MTDYSKLYGEIHQSHKRFPGFSLKAYLDPITALVEQHKPTRMLDFGCGKARSYTERNYHDAWGGMMPELYDVGVPEFSVKPIGQFGGVICSDVMEHIDKPDVPCVLDELISYVEPGGFLFLGISCRPTRKKLPDGRDVHLTIEPPAWWIEQIKAADYRNSIVRPNEHATIHIVAHWDVDGHFDCSDEPWDRGAE